jgi:hypothetical protein
LPNSPDGQTMTSMRPKQGGLAWSAFAVAVAFSISTATFGIVNDGTRLPAAEGDEIKALGDLLFGLITITFAALGALLASRRPRNPIGWVLCVSAVALSFTGVARGWYLHTQFADPGSLPLAPGLMWAANWGWVPGFMPLLTLLLLLFPDGRPPSRRWRPVGWVALTGMTLLILGYGFAPGALEDYPQVRNPLGVEGAAGDVFEVFKNVGFPLFMLAAIGSMASLVRRFRRSHGEERQQLKWMAAAAAFVVVAWIVTAVCDQLFDVDITFLLTVGLLALPAATTIAILRYRLYDLGLVVNRALVYGALSATLVASYLGCVLLLQLALGPLTEDNGLAIAGSTLAAAGLFRPARSRIQELVDRRFYRHKYDAAQTVEAFTARLRDEVELQAVSAELGAAVRQTMQPTHVSLWLRQPEGAR